MKKFSQPVSIFYFLAFSFCLLIFSSCSKEEVAPKEGLIAQDLKNITLNTGFTDNVIPIKADSWAVSYVKDALTGELLKDSMGNALKLKSVGTVEMEAGWLTLEKTASNELKLSLQENFSDRTRNFVIGIQSSDKQEEMSFSQSRGDEYELIKKEIEEIAGSRKIYVSSEGCSSLTVRNDSDQEKNVETLEIFKDVKYSSEFSSNSYGAFDWIGKKDAAIFMDEVLIDDVSHWQGKVPYVKGKTFEDYIKPGNSQTISLKPHRSLSIRGEFTYLERNCNYTFTIKNKNSGHRFNVKGTWKQKVPLISHTIIE
ncbi:MAG: hypothetical protein LBF27_31245 [Sphingobacterium sp.]|jgi:hypothetical protein|nr:hypothetical protein [Sphingobacterium sp.]